MLKYFEKLIEVYYESFELELEAELAVLASMLPEGSNHASLGTDEDISC